MNDFFKRAGALGTAAMLTLTAAGCGAEQPDAPASEGTETSQPDGEKTNIVYILLDDTGYADLGCYGSSISTPNMDELARQGILYSDYYTQPMSSPSRASILTGCESNRVGMGVISDVDFGGDVPSINGCVYPEHGTLAETLKENGYSTIAVGKWHLGPFPEFAPGGDMEHWPSGKGFEQNYCFVGSQANMFQTGGLIYGDEYVLADIDTGDYHFTTDMVDHSLEFIDNAGEDPFFLYFATGAMHGPFQAPQEYIEKYKGKFSHGWDVERERRLAKQIEDGLLPEGTVLPPMPEGVAAWDDLSDVQKQVAERHMEVFAGFLEHTDMEIGRLIDELKARDKYENTIFVLTSDNGPNSNGMPEGSPSAHVNENLMAYSSEEQLQWMDQYGGPEYGPQYNKGWCMASATPFRYHKTTCYNGGLRVPHIVTWPAGIVEPGRVCHDVIDSTDITPTMLDVLGIEQVMEIDGVKQHPMEGGSYKASLLSAEPMKDWMNEMCFMLLNNYAYSDGEYMICDHPATRVPALYHMADDPTQIHDLRESEPEKFQELFDGFEAKKREYNAQNLLVDFIQGFPEEVLIERYGELAATVLEALETNVEPEDPEAAEWFIKLRTFGMKVGKSGYTGVATSWYDAPDSKHSARDYTYDPDDGFFFAESSAPTGVVSHVITADVINKGEPEGVIVANGGIDGGYVMYVKDGKLTFEYNFCNERVKVQSDKALPEGEVTLAYQYDKKDVFNGTGTLLVNGEAVATAPMKQLPMFNSFDYFSMGADVGSKVSKDYNDDYTFNGEVEEVRIHLGDDLWEKNS